MRNSVYVFQKQVVIKIYENSAEKKGKGQRERERERERERLKIDSVICGADVSYI